MASEKEDTDIDNSLSTWQKFSAGFAGDASAQMAKKRQMKHQNDQQAELDAVRQRMNQSTEPK